MKTVIEIAEREIAELWSSPSDQPTYTQIFEILERVKPIFTQQIIDAVNFTKNTNGYSAEEYYSDTFNTTNKETLK